MYSLVVLVLGVMGSPVFGQSINNVRVIDHATYFTKLMQETMTVIERRGWCSLKLQDQVQDYNTSIFSWDINGEVTYTNGFLISIASMDLQTSTVQQIWGVETIDNATTTTVRIDGTLRLHEVALGYDIEARMDDGDHYFTGVYTHEKIEFRLSLTKNMNTHVMTTAGSMTSLSGGNVRKMIYMPETKLTEFLSRNYAPSDASDGIREWASKSFVPILLDVATTKIEFPGLCYNCHW